MPMVEEPTYRNSSEAAPIGAMNTNAVAKNANDRMGTSYSNDARDG
jgi:hypothetical protein